MNLIIAAVLVLGLSGFGTQSIQRDSIGSVIGTAIRTDNQDPIPQVRITVRPVGSAGGTASGTLSAVTDAGGKFILINVSAGEYTISAQREGYLVGWGTSAEVSRTFRVMVRQDEQTRVPPFAFVPGAAVAGRIADSSGDPKSGLTVELLEEDYSQGVRQWQVQATNRGETNDRGEYRMFSVPPGRYYLRVSDKRRMVPNAAQGLRVNVASTSYFPGVRDALSAAEILLAPGADVVANVTIPSHVMRKIAGRVVVGSADMDSMPRVVLGLAARGPGQPVQEPLPVLILPERSDGVFEVGGIGPGSYELFAIARGRNPASGLAGSGDLYIGRASFTVGDRDIENVTISLLPGVTVRGKVTFVGDFGTHHLIERNGGSGGGGIGVRENEVYVGVELVSKDRLPSQPRWSAKIEGDAFVFEGVPQGTFLVHVDVFSKSGFVAEIRQGSQDIFDDGIIVGSQALNDIEVVVAKNGGAIQGTLDRNSGLRTLVALVPQPPHRRNNQIYYNALADSNGRFSFTGVRPGDYKLFAWDFPEGPSRLPYRYPGFLEAYESKGLLVTVKGGMVTGNVVVPTSSPQH